MLLRSVSANDDASWSGPSAVPTFHISGNIPSTLKLPQGVAVRQLSNVAIYDYSNCRSRNGVV